MKVNELFYWFCSHQNHYKEPDKAAMNYRILLRNRIKRIHQKQFYWLAI